MFLFSIYLLLFVDNLDTIVLYTIVLYTWEMAYSIANVNTTSHYYSWNYDD